MFATRRVTDDGPMKYVIVIPDGCADEPQQALGGKTPLEAARTPNMDRLAELGLVGRANHTPSNLPAGSDVANLSLFGYDPNINFTGRAPIEAAAQGIALADNDWVIRCNLVTIQDQTMRDFTAGHISSEEAAALLATAQQNVGTDRPLEFIPGVSYRNLLVYRTPNGDVSPFSFETRTTPPHDLTDQAVMQDFPRGPGSPLLSELMSHSVEWFADHSVNRQRITAGKLPATNIWLWGLGKRPKLEVFAERHGIRGAMITAVDLLRGLASLIGWDRIEVPGATGYIDTNYAAKGRHAIAALDKFDLICVHIEAPDEASHEGIGERKIAAIEAIDRDIVGPLLGHVQKLPAWRMMVTPDHPTLLTTKTHSHGDVPFAIAGTNIAPVLNDGYSERVATASNLAFPQGHELMKFFIGGN